MPFLQSHYFYIADLHLFAILFKGFDNMAYIPLYEIYYKQNNEWFPEYQKRFNNLFAKHLDITIKEFNREKEFQLFYCHTEYIVTLQNKIMFDFLRLQKLFTLLPGAGINQFLKSCMIEEIQSTNEIEGVRSTHQEIREAIFAQGKYNPDVRLWGIVNKYNKIINDENIKLKTCEDIRNLYDDFILDEIKRNNTSDIPDGNIFKKNSVDIVSGTQKTIHRGVYPESKIIDYMTKALQFLHDDSVSIFIRIAVFHYLFGYIHPFYDGNGRMSRFITSYFLSKNLHPTIALRLSVLIKQHKNDYYKLFENTNSQINCGDLTPFIIWSLEFIASAITSTYKLLFEKYELFSSLNQKLDEMLKNEDKTTKRVYNVLLQAAVFSDMGATSHEIVQTLKLSKRTIDARIKEIPNEILLADKTSRPYHYKLRLSFFEQ